VSDSGDSIAGWYGKLPMLGDFAHRRLPLEFITACDAWLSQGIAASRESLGAAWLDAYLTAPLWCFAWSPRIVDERWWFGVMMPSVDAVGRYFPLIVAFSAPQAPTDAQALASWAQWYESAGRCAMQTLQDRATLDEFEEALAAMATPTAAAADAPADTADAEWRLHTANAAWPQDAATIVLRSLAARLQGLSTWWPQQGSTEHAPPVTVMQGLPAAQHFAGLLHGARFIEPASTNSNESRSG
jgi:type VI secretion system protein ImpM